MRNNHEVTAQLAQAEKCAAKYGKQLYHYTSLSSLYGIICNKELWLGNTAMMNDKCEMTNFIDSMQTTALTDFPEKRDEILSISTELKKDIDHKHPYIIYLSELEDNAAQWERYADNATGVCIAFNTEMLSYLFMQYNGFIQKVFYGCNIRNHEHYEILRKYLLSSKTPGFSNRESWLNNILATASSHKHPSFTSECEYRAIIFPELISLSQDSLHIDYKLVGSHIKKVLVVKYDNCDRIHMANLFDHIIIGPRSPQNIHVLKNFLCDKGFPELAEKVFYSDCPLR